MSLLEVMLLDCYKQGDFILSSGKKSDEYYDLTSLLLDCRGLNLIGIQIMNTLKKIEYDALGCLELSSVSLVGVLLFMCRKKGFIVRKEQKGYGTNKLVEGDLKFGDKVVIIEDVISTGQSVLKAINAVKELGCEVVCIIAIINRQEGCDELLKDYNFKWLFTKVELEKIRR